MNKQEYYQKIFEEYQDLKGKTEMVAGNLDKNGKYEFNHIKPDELMRRVDLEKELTGNLKFLTDEQLKALYKDNDLVGEAVKTFVERNK